MTNPLLRDNASALLAEHRRLVKQVADRVEINYPAESIILDLRELWRLGDAWEAEADRLARHLADAS